MPTTTMTSPNRASSFSPSSALATVEPARAPSTPAAANTAAQRHLTFPARQCVSRLPRALTETAKALVPMATCGEAHPTT